MDVKIYLLLAALLMTKLTALCFVAVFVLLLIIRVRKSLSTVVPVFLRLFVILGLLCGPYLFYRFVSEGEGNIAGDGACLDEPLRVPVGLRFIVTFDPIDVVLHPFTDTRGDGVRREYFWEFLFRSSLYGEFKAQGLEATLAPVLSFVWLLYLIWGAIQILFLFSGALKPFFPLFLLGLISVMGMLWARFILPFSCHQDFRFMAYIGPFFGVMLSCFSGRLSKYCSMGIGILFSLLSLAYLIGVSIALP